MVWNMWLIDIEAYQANGSEIPITKPVKIRGESLYQARKTFFELLKRDGIQSNGHTVPLPESIDLASLISMMRVKQFKGDEVSISEFVKQIKQSVGDRGNGSSSEALREGSKET